MPKIMFEFIEFELGMHMILQFPKVSGRARNFIEFGQKIYRKTLFPTCG